MRAVCPSTMALIGRSGERVAAVIASRPADSGHLVLSCVLCSGTSLILYLVITTAQAVVARSKRLPRACLDKQPQASRNAVTACKWPNSATPLLLLLLLLSAGLPNVSAQGLWALPICARSRVHASARTHWACGAAVRLVSTIWRLVKKG